MSGTEYGPKTRKCQSKLHETRLVMVAFDVLFIFQHTSALYNDVGFFEFTQVNLPGYSKKPMLDNALM